MSTPASALALEMAAVTCTFISKGAPGQRYTAVRDVTLLLDAAVGHIERRLMKWQPKAGETEKL